MSDFARIQGNVQKMVNQQAPPEDIDGYLKTEGLTPETFKAQMAGPSSPQQGLSDFQGGHDGPSLQDLRDPTVTFNDPRFRQESPHGLGYALNEMARAAANGATLGYADKLAAHLSSGDYEKNLAMQQGTTEQSKEYNPGGYKLAEGLGFMGGPGKVVGSIVNKAVPFAAGNTLREIGQRYLNYGVQGGTLRALYDKFLGDNPDQANKDMAAAGGAAGVGMVAPPDGDANAGALGQIRRAVPGVAKSFGIGAAEGMAVPGLLEGGSAIVKAVLTPILARLNPEEAAIAGLGRAADRSGLTPDMLESKIEKLGDRGMIANVGTGVTDYARDTAQFPGKARVAAQAGFGAQQGGRMATSGGAVGRVEDAIGQTLSDETAKASTDALVDLRTKSSSPLWQKMFAEPKVPESSVLDVMAENPEVKKGMATGLATIRNDLNAQGVATSDANYFVKGKPTFQAWHAAKEGLDDTLFSGSADVVNPLTGQLTKYGRSVNNLRSSILDELKLHFPEYEDALNTWSGPTQAMRMIELGQKAARGDARVTSDLLGELTDNEKDFFRIGLADQAKYLVSKTKDGANVVKSIFGDQNQRRNLAAAFDTRADFNEFRKALAIEQKFYDSKGAILGGSPTATRLLGAEDAGQEIGKATLHAAAGNAPGAAVNLLQKGAAYLKGQPEAVRDEASKFLFSTDPEVKRRVIDALRANQNKGSIFGSPGMTWLPGIGAVNAARFGGP